MLEWFFRRGRCQFFFLGTSFRSFLSGGEVFNPGIEIMKDWFTDFRSSSLNEFI